MVFQDVAFLPLLASSYITFLHYCGRGKGLSTTRCLESVAGGKQGHASVEYLGTN